jgi:type I restriction enzyme S subunit
VNFDPVRAKAASRQPEGMDAETAALFPDSFEETTLGEVPRGWPISPLASVHVHSWYPRLHLRARRVRHVLS